MSREFDCPCTWFCELEGCDECSINKMAKENAELCKEIKELKAKNIQLSACHESELGVCKEYCDVVAELRNQNTELEKQLSYYENSNCESCKKIGALATLSKLQKELTELKSNGIKQETELDIYKKALELAIEKNDKELYPRIKVSRESSMFKNSKYKLLQQAKAELEKEKK